MKRHPKICKIFNKEETCKFGIDCAYNHKEETYPNINVQDIQIKHNKEVSDLKVEVEKLKETVSQTELKIDLLTKDYQKKKETQIEDIEKIVVNMLNNQKNLETYFELLKEDTYLNHCDLCIFNCKKENDMILHLSNWHDDCSSWDLCGKYFGTKQLLENHNKETHNKRTT